MREFMDKVKLLEGDVVSLAQHKTDKAFGAYGDALAGLIGGELDFFSTGKFSPFAKSYIESGFDPKFAPEIMITVYFRDMKMTPEARALLVTFKKPWKVQRVSFSKDYKGHKEGPWADRTISWDEAKEIWSQVENSPYGAYCQSRSGMRTAHKENYDERGVGFSLIVGGQDGRRGDKYGNDTREEHHIIDDQKDFEEVSHMFALIARARMAAVK